MLRLLAMTQEGWAVGPWQGGLGDSRGLTASSPSTLQRPGLSPAHMYPA